MRRLFDWLESGGATTPALAVIDDPQGATGERTVVARRSISGDAVVLRIPRPLLMAVEDMLAGSLGRRFLDGDVALATKHSLIAAFLLGERERCSFWTPYLATLPRSFKHLPFHWREEQRAMLAGSLAGERLQAQTASITADYTSLCGALPEFAASHSSNDFADARLAVVSRVFGVQIDGAKTEAMVPLADLMNHRLPPDVTWAYSDAAEGFIMRARHAISAGDVVHDSYGRKCNSRLLVNYGFVLPDNDDDETFFDFPEPGRGERFTTAPARGWGERRGLRRRFLVSTEPASARAMFSFLRLACARDDELAVAAPLLRTNAPQLPPLGSRNERAALEALRTVVTRALARRREPSEAAVASSKKARLTAVALRGERRVLAAYLELVEQALPLLSLSAAELARAVAGRQPSKRLADRYLADLGERLVGAVRQPDDPSTS